MSIAIFMTPMRPGGGGVTRAPVLSASPACTVNFCMSKFVLISTNSSVSPTVFSELACWLNAPSIGAAGVIE